ncbi:hypothetical protein B0H19DRAFT_1150649 [Mycena capillaripes]|nr:hypothetical protein B0H19DRAFT_1150649 [Mycena capillaripes]
MTPNEKKLKKAKDVFLKHLKEIDTSDGPVNQVILKFHLTRDVELAFESFVRHYGCTMSTRIISRAEQDAVDRRQKNCAQYTSVLVTPEAQAAFLGKKSNPDNLGREILASYQPTTPPKAQKHIVQYYETALSSPEVVEQIIFIPGAKYDDLSARLSGVIRRLPTTDTFRGKRCRSELIDIAHELRAFRPGAFNIRDEEEEMARTLSESEGSICV